MKRVSIPATIEEAVAQILAEAAAEMLHFSHVQAAANERPETVPANAVSLPQFFATESPRGCPYQVDGLCTARNARPLGCRLYFCDENAQSWQNEVYEKYHARLT